MTFSTSSRRDHRPLIRGVNLGGWLMQERYITPYHFAITDCHLQGDFCWYPGQLSAPNKHSEEYKLCDLYKCKPIRSENVFGQVDYPMDEYTLGQAFANKDIGAQWLDYHLANFVTRDDILEIAQNGVTHIRVPLPHWILGDVQDGEPWIVGNRWSYFVQLCNWCREVGIDVWPDIHTAPGSQNGFDNSGHQLAGSTSKGWSENAGNIARTLQVLRDVTAAIVREGVDDVVTGFGLLNEPFLDANRNVILKYNDDGLKIVRETLGQDTAVYIHDGFSPKSWGHTSFVNSWWKDPVRYNNTYLDSHFYQVFAEHPRALSPREHIAYACQYQTREFTSCCYRNWPFNHRASQGIRRMVGEWSAAYDTLPVVMLKDVMDGIATDGIMPLLDREMSKPRQNFLRNFVEAQMVSWEAEDLGISDAWFYWTLKMEGGAFAEWDFMRGLREGWIPKIPPPDVTSQSLYGRCYDIIFRTDDSMDIIDVFPDPSTLPANRWEGVSVDDDVVVSHGQSLIHKGGRYYHPKHHYGARWLMYATFFVAGVVFWRFISKWRNSKRHDYERLDSETDSEDEIESPFSRN